MQKMRNLYILYISLTFAAVAAYGQQTVAPFKTDYGDFTVGIQLQNSYGTAGQTPCSTGIGVVWGNCGGGTITLTTTGTGGAATYSLGTLNIPIYQTALGYTPTNAAVVPSTAPSAGQILVGNAGGTAYAPQTMSSDATLASTGALTLATVNSGPGTCGDATHTCAVTVNGKGLTTAQSQVAITFPTVATSIQGTAPITANGVSGSPQTGAVTLAIPAATSSVNGYLASSDWSTFNGKQNALSLVAGTYVNGDMCTYALSGTLLNCNTAIPTALPTPNALTMNNSNTGAASGTTFDGSVARTISTNTIGAPNLTTVNAFTNNNSFVAGSDAGTGVTVAGHSATQSANVFIVYDYPSHAQVFSIGNAANNYQVIAPNALYGNFITTTGSSSSINAWGSTATDTVLTVEETTVATSGANQNSPKIQRSGNFWNGSVGGTDNWTDQEILGSGSNPTSTLTFAHSGSSGAAAVSFPNIIDTAYTGTAASCAYFDTNGKLNGTGSACGSGGSGDTITSPNSTLAVGGTSTNTTLDLVGSAGEIMAGATPALTYTPTLGKSGTAGTLSLFPASGNFTTTIGTAATANSTFNLPATAATNLHTYYAAVSGTTATLTDTGYPYNAIPFADLAPLSANQILGALTGTTPSGLSVPSCSGATNALIWTSGTGFGCNTISGGGSSALSGITAATGSNTIASGNNSGQVWNWALTTNSVTAMTFGETTAATGTSDKLVAITTIAGSTAVPLTLTSSLTGSQNLPTVQITPTWNTSATVDAAFLMNVTNTASGIGSLLMDLQVGGTSQFKVDKIGDTTVPGTTLGVGTAFTNTGKIVLYGSGSANSAVITTSTQTASSVTYQIPALPTGISYAPYANASNQLISAGILNAATQTTVSCSTSGTAVFSEPDQGSSVKHVTIHMAACLGTASYTFATAFTNTPSVYASNNAAAGIATSVSTSAVTVTGTTTTGSLILEDY